MNTKKYPIILITLLLCSYLAPVLDSQEMSDPNKPFETSSRSSSCIGDICISEVLVNAFGAETGAVGPADWTSGEWVELYNSGTTTVDLSTWNLGDHYDRPLSMTTGNVVHPTAATNMEIPAGDYIVLARNGDGGSCGFCMKNSNGMVNLSDASGNLVHSISWTTSPTEGVTLIEDANDPAADWIESSTISPGESNQGGTPTGPVYFPGDLVINEVMADAYPSYDNGTWPDGEWVEIHNQGNSPIDMTGWHLKDAAGNTVEFNQNHLVGYTADPNSMIINAGELRVIAINGSSNSGVLNNAIETLSIHWPNGSIADEVNWSSNEPGFSLSRTHGTDEMFTSAYPTVNATNIGAINTLATMSSDLIITEYLPSTNTTGNFPDGKWIEIHNDGVSSINLLGWSITNGRGEILYFDPGTIIFNQSHSSATDISPDERRLIQMSNNFDLYDYYEHLVMKDDNGNIVDSGWHSNYFGDNVSMVRDLANIGAPWLPSNWLTPGQPEPGDEPYSMKDLQFSEILPDGLGLDTQSWLSLIHI